MATRLYLESTSSAPAISPAADAAWTSAAGMTRVRAATTKLGSALTTEEKNGSGVNPNTLAVRQAIFGPLAAQTISGTFTAQMRGSEEGSSLNARHAICIRVIGPDGTTVRGTLRALINGNEYAVTTLTNARPEAGGTDDDLTNVDAQAGDYLVIDWGFRYASALTQWARQRWGSSAGSDLPQDLTTTTDLDPWIEFSGTISLQTMTFFPTIHTKVSLLKSNSRAMKRSVLRKMAPRLHGSSLVMVSPQSPDNPGTGGTGGNPLTTITVVTIIGEI